MSRRDRQRRRRAANPGPRPSEPHRDNVPGSLDHASGQVDEFEAAIVEGAERQDEASEAFGEEEDAEAGREAEDEGPEAGREALGEDEDDVDLDEELEEQAVAAAHAERVEVAAAPTPGTPTRRGPARFIGFLRASWAELQRVQWPDRRAVSQATAVVIGFVVVAGLYLGVADWVAKKIVDFII